MAEHAGVSPATVQRIWDARGLKPHRVETFKLSSDLSRLSARRPKLGDSLSSGLLVGGAGDGNRTRMTSLEGNDVAFR
jgi:uncharacterized membrane-anchored protein